jgi:hypothetical protein
MTDRWRAAVFGGLAEGEELADAQHLDPADRRHPQKECIARRVEQLVAELPAPPALVEAKPAGAHLTLVVVEARSEGPGYPRSPNA